MKPRVVDFTHKKETRKKRIRASQLAIRNFNDITGNLVFFIFTLFSLKAKTFQTFLQEKNHLFLFVKSKTFSCTAHYCKENWKMIYPLLQSTTLSIGILTKGNLKNNLAYKNIQTRVSQMFSVPCPAVPKTATACRVSWTFMIYGYRIHATSKMELSWNS